MSDKDLNEIQTKIALLEKDAKTGEQIHRRLEIAIDKLSDCAISLKGMLAQQEQKLTKAEQTDEDIFITLEARRKEWDNDLKELHSRITTNTKELREHQIQSENNMLNELRHMRQQLSERVGVLEKWRWLIIGGSIIIGLMMSNPSGNLWDFLNQSLDFFHSFCYNISMSSYIDIKFINLLSTRLPKFKRKSEYLFNFRCPHCGDSQKSLTKARGFVYKKE